MENISSMFTPPAGDWSFMFLQDLFSTITVLGQLLFYFNSIVGTAGAIILLYVVMHGVVDTAHTGRPLGEFSEIWVPLRMVIAFTLAVPLPTGQGLNAAQEIFYVAAEWGIGAADQLWGRSINALTMNASPIVAPPPAEATELAHGLFISEVCAMAANTLAAREGTAPWVPPPAGVSTAHSYLLIWNGDSNQGFNDGMCGSITVTLPSSIPNAVPGSSTAQALLSAHMQAVTTMLQLASGDAQTVVTDLMNQTSAAPLPASSALAGGIAPYGVSVQQAASAQIAGATQSATASFAANAQQLGWASAGAYLVQIAAINDTILKAGSATPTAAGPNLGSGPTAWAPADRAEMVRVLSLAEQWWQSMLGRTASVSSASAEMALAGGADQGPLLQKAGLTPQLFTTAFFTSGVLGQQNTTNPIAALTAMGHTMITSFYGALVGTAIASGTIEAIKEGSSATASQIFTFGGSAYVSAAAGGVLQMLQTLGWFVTLLLFGLLVNGIFYAYILPAIPFIFWFYALTGWFVRIGTSMLVAPIWGVSHLAPSGSGPVPQQSLAGYVLLAEILFQPPLMIIGLFLAYAILLGMVQFFFVIYQQVIIGSLAGHGDLFTGALVYMGLGALLLGGMVYSCMRMVTMITDTVIGFAGLQASRVGGYLEYDAAGSYGGVDRGAAGAEGAGKEAAFAGQRGGGFAGRGGSGGGTAGGVEG